MLKGTLRAVVQAMAPVSIHGQRSWDITYVPAAQPCAPSNTARVGVEAAPPDLHAGEEVELHLLLGQVIEVRRVAAESREPKAEG